MSQVYEVTMPIAEGYSPTITTKVKATDPAEAVIVAIADVLATFPKVRPGYATRVLEVWS